MSLIPIAPTMMPTAPASVGPTRTCSRGARPGSFSPDWLLVVYIVAISSTAAGNARSKAPAAVAFVLAKLPSVAPGRSVAQLARGLRQPLAPPWGVVAGGCATAARQQRRPARSARAPASSSSGPHLLSRDLQHLIPEAAGDRGIDPPVLGREPV